MLRIKFEKIVFAFLSVIITVNLFEFYNISLEKRGMSKIYIINILKRTQKYR